MLAFRPGRFMLPKVDDMSKWAVIACDQFTSEKEYWDDVYKNSGDGISSLHLIYPEYELKSSKGEKINKIIGNMTDYLNRGVFEEYPDSYIYIERTMENGSIRQGLLGVVDLEEYDFRSDRKAGIKATEETVMERIPPRMEIRKCAPIELSHVILLLDDMSRTIIEPLTHLTNRFKELYDFDLGQNGGHITGWLITGEDRDALERKIDSYEKTKETYYQVGDGNHSLATAKSCYEKLKKNLSEDEYRNHPARYASVEVCNIYEDAEEIEPIHRLVKDCDEENLFSFLRRFESEDGYPVKWYSGERMGCIFLDRRLHQVPVGALQQLLDEYLEDNRGETDYIHGEDSVRKLSEGENSVGFILPDIDKGELFSAVERYGSMPRKTFSIGHAREKRYYLETRKII